jgi:uncharacterized RDD family membrane protein YckC
MNFAGFWIRFVALLIDSIILAIVSILIGFVLGLFLGVLGAEPEQAAVVGNVVGILIAWLYFALQESSPKQATIGKQAMGISVSDLNGDRITFARATGRYFAKILSGIILLIGYIMAAFTEKRQALHDMIAGTVVVKG